MATPIILVTGSTSGIGRATAATLLSRGAEVILHGRDEGRGREAQKDLAKQHGGTKPDLVIADLSDQLRIRQTAADISSRYTRLDVLLNNAGTYEKKHRLTPEGAEMTFAVNYLAPFLLTGLLLPLLRKSAPSRIVTVASTAHEDVDRIDWDDLPAITRYDPWQAYALSKFADITFTYRLARELEGTGVTANCLHPGVTDTKLLRGAFPGIPGISAEEGAKTSVYLALSPEAGGVSGGYFMEMKAARSSALTHDRAVQDRLWKMAVKLTGR